MSIEKLRVRALAHGVQPQQHLTQDLLGVELVSGHVIAFVLRLDQVIEVGEGWIALRPHPAEVGTVCDAPFPIQLGEHDLNGVDMGIREILVGAEEVLEEGNVLRQQGAFSEGFRCGLIFGVTAVIPKLDKEAAALPAEEQPAKPTKFETDKEKLRQAIRTALSSAASYGEFAAVLLQQGVTVKESRGRLSYLTPDRTKPITARKLGDDFDRAAVLTLLEQNAHRAAEKTVPIPEYHTAETNRTERGKTQKIAPTGNIQRMVDRAAKRAEGKGIGYDRWAAVHNLKQMAATVAAMEQYGFTPDELDAALVSANADLHSSTAKLKPIETAIREKKDLQKQVLAYAKTSPEPPL